MAQPRIIATHPGTEDTMPRFATAIIFALALAAGHAPCSAAPTIEDMLSFTEPESSAPTKAAGPKAAKAGGAAPVRKAHKAGSVKDIFTSEMLYADIKKLRAIAGKPVETHQWEDTYYQTYKVGGCSVDVETDGKVVQALGMDLSPVCTFDLDAMMGSLPHVKAHLATFGDFPDGEFFCVCLPPLFCNQAESGRVSMEYLGPHSDGYTIAEPSCNYGNSDSAFDAAYSWGNHMKTKEGEDFLVDGDKSKYKGIAYSLFKNVRIERIKFRK